MIVDESGLPESFRYGLESIRNLHFAYAKVLAVEANFAYIDLGEMVLPDFYVQDLVQVFGRVPLSFPLAQPYGIVTAPLLQRKDGRPIERLHANHQTARPVEVALGISGAGFWSWNWQNMPLQKPTDLAAIFEWARKRIRQG